MEEIQEGQTSMSLSLGDESIVAWMGDRLSSCCGLRISQEHSQKLHGIVRMRMMVHSLSDPIRYFQLVESHGGNNRLDSLGLLFDIQRYLHGTLIGTVHC